MRTLVTILNKGKTLVKILKPETVIIFPISIFLQYSIHPLYNELPSLYNKTSNSFQFLCNNNSKNIPSVSNNHYIIKTKILSLFCCIGFFQRRHLGRHVYPMKQKCQLNDWPVLSSAQMNWPMTWLSLISNSSRSTSECQRRAKIVFILYIMSTICTLVTKINFSLKSW